MFMNSPDNYFRWAVRPAGAGIVFLSALGMVLIHTATSWGPVIFSDAAGYLDVAMNLIGGHGLGHVLPDGSFRLLTSHLPGYPVFLAFFGWLGADLVQVARWVGIVSFGALIFLTGGLSFRFSRSVLVSWSACCMVLAAPWMLDLFSLAMSDTLFMMTSFVGVMLILVFIEQGQPALLGGASVAFGLSVMTRYVGLAFVLAGMVSILLLSAPGWRRRLSHSVLFAMISFLPLLIFLAWMYFQPNMEPPRDIEVGINYLARFNQVRVEIVNVYWEWLPFHAQLPNYPYRVKLLILVCSALVLFFGTAVMLWMLYKAKHCQRKIINLGRYSSAVWIFIVAYWITLVTSYLFATPFPDINDRILAPTFPLLILVFLIPIHLLAKARPSWTWSRILPIMGPLIFIFAFAPASWDLLSRYSQDGHGYLGRSWRTSATLQAVRELPNTTPLISNESSAIAFLIGRPCYSISEIVNSTPVAEYSRYGDDPQDRPQVIFRASGGALILFNSARWQLDPLYHDQTLKRLEALTDGLITYGEYFDGSIYFYLPR